jgi:chromate transport protein ChrA
MDETAKEQFKWKFYRLAVQLNAIILIVALTVVACFLVPNPYKIPAIIVMLALALVLSWNFIINYRLTKEWLDEH